MSIILFVFILAILVLVHEFGHFIVAKKNGIRVDEFGFGFPPRVLKLFKKGETTYTLNLLPIGGFVKIHGENGSTELTTGGEGESDSDSFSSKPIWVRMLVIVAGVTFNLILGWILISTGFILGLPVSTGSVASGADVSDVKVIVLQVDRESPAGKNGLMAGDEIVGFSSVGAFQNFVAENKGKEIEVKYKRGEDVLSVALTPRVETPEGQGPIGIAMDEVGMAKWPWYRAIWEGLKMTLALFYTIAITLFYFIVDIFSGLVGLESMMGPIGIAGATGAVAKLGFSYLLSFAAMLSVNLAVINLIPFPALDGGRLLFLLIEKIKGSPVNENFTAVVNNIGFLLLIILMIAITYQDILRIV